MEKEIGNYKKIDWNKQYKYKNKNIYIVYETKDYILCSYNQNKKSIFKLDKTKFNFK